jgi:hypothetical protein
MQTQAAPLLTAGMFAQPRSHRSGSDEAPIMKKGIGEAAKLLRG